MLEKPSNAAFTPSASGDPAFREVLEKISNTKEVRQLAGNVIPELIRLWAISGTGAGPVRSTFRKSVAGAAGSSIKKALLDDKGLAEAPALHTLAGDLAFARQASLRTGELVDGLMTVLVKGAAEIETLDTDTKKILIETIIGDLSSGRSAELLTRCSRIINDIHRDEPGFLSRVLAPEFENWLKKMDFGELKELLESALPGVSSLVGMINETLWNYPGKVISIVSLIPSLTNMLIDALAQTACAFNNKGTPDMVADVLLTVLKETDTGAVGRLINELAEQIRQLHVGSALIGEPGAPQLPNDLAVLFDAVIQSVDGDVLLKARTALAELKSQAHCALTDVMIDHPDLLAGSLAATSEVHNARIKTVSHRLTALEGLEPSGTIDDALCRLLTNLDVQEGANIINAATLLTLRLLESRPEDVNDRVKSLVDALDVYGLAELSQKTGEVIGRALRPLARSVIPHLARGVLATLAADDDEFEDAAEEARHLLADFLQDGKAEHNG